MALLHWNDVILVLSVVSHQYFLSSALTILSSFSHSSFHHATGDHFFASEDVLGMVFSAACNMVLIRQLCASSIVFWSCTLLVILLSFC